MTNFSGDGSLRPVTPGERIEELDVVRGFALLGIFLMNVEFFNRPIASLSEGMPRGLTGLDWFASWFITYFVQGKFWTIFSLLFGMGFAVMLARAERASRSFLVPYLRRILALAVFGALHFIFLWEGDILFSYAVAAAGLLILLYGRWLPILISVVVLGGLAFVPGLVAAARVAGTVAFIGLLALYMRGDTKVNLRFARVPLSSFIVSILGTLGVIASTVLWVLPDGPKDLRLPVTMVSVLLLVIAYLSARYRDPVELRSLRLGVALYALPALVAIGAGTVQYLSPPDPHAAAVTAPSGARAGEPAAAPAPSDAAAKERAERAKRIEETEQKKRDEERVLSQGSYGEGVAMRARDFTKRLGWQTVGSVFSISMFLIGVWFVRSGVVKNVGAHMRLFRRFAYYGLPFGVGLGLLGSLLASSHTPGNDNDGFALARGLSTLGSLPASLGYVGLVVMALHSDTVFAKVRVLAPAGRMALTNYLAQTLISTTVFYGYGLGQWGLARSWQVVYVVAVFALQVVFSHWWLARFRYGPMERFWRAFTYLEKTRVANQLPR